MRLLVFSCDGWRAVLKEAKSKAHKSWGKGAVSAAMVALVTENKAAAIGASTIVYYVAIAAALPAVTRLLWQLHSL